MGFCAVFWVWAGSGFCCRAEICRKKEEGSSAADCVADLTDLTDGCSALREESPEGKNARKGRKGESWQRWQLFKELTNL